MYSASSVILISIIQHLDYPTKKVYTPHSYLKTQNDTFKATLHENQKGIDYRTEAWYLQTHSYRYILYEVLRKLMTYYSHTNLKGSKKIAGMGMKNKDDWRLVSICS